MDWWLFVGAFSEFGLTFNMINPSLILDKKKIQEIFLLFSFPWNHKNIYNDCATFSFLSSWNKKRIVHERNHLKTFSFYFSHFISRSLSLFLSLALLSRGYYNKIINILSHREANKIFPAFMAAVKMRWGEGSDVNEKYAGREESAFEFIKIYVIERSFYSFFFTEW